MDFYVIPRNTQVQLVLSMTWPCAGLQHVCKCPAGAGHSSTECCWTVHFTPGCHPQTRSRSLELVWPHRVWDQFSSCIQGLKDCITGFQETTDIKAHTFVHRNHKHYHQFLCPQKPQALVPVPLSTETTNITKHRHYSWPLCPQISQTLTLISLSTQTTTMKLIIFIHTHTRLMHVRSNHWQASHHPALWFHDWVNTPLTVIIHWYYYYKHTTLSNFNLIKEKHSQRATLSVPFLVLWWPWGQAQGRQSAGWPWWPWGQAQGRQ